MLCPPVKLKQTQQQRVKGKHRSWTKKNKELQEKLAATLDSPDGETDDEENEVCPLKARKQNRGKAYMAEKL